MIGNIIGGFVAILVGVSLMPEVSKQVSQFTATQNMTGTQGEFMLKLIPGVFALGIICIGIAVAYSGLKNTGLIGGDSGEDEEYEDENEEEEEENYDEEDDVLEEEYVPKPKFKSSGSYKNVPSKPRITESEIKLEEKGEKYFTKKSRFE